MSEIINQNEKAIFFTPKKIILSILIATVIFSLGFISVVCLYVSSYDKIYPNVSVNGLNIGNLTKEDAIQLISDNTSGFLDNKRLTITCNDISQTVNAHDLGASLDIEATVQNAYNIGRQGNAIDNARIFFSKDASQKSLPISIECHPDMLTRLINEITLGREIPVIQPSYEVTGNQLVLHFGKPGIMIDRAGAKETIEKTLSEFDITSINLTLENIDPSAFDIDKLYDAVTSPPANAYYDRNIREEVVVMPSVSQVAIDKSTLKNAIDNNSHLETYSIPVQVTLPEVTTDILQGKLFRDILAAHTTYFNSADVGRSSNVRNAANRINNHTLLPNEIFTYDKTLGPRTIANGFSIAHVYVGNKVEDGLGGGICQVSSTLYCVALYADLEIVERHNHSLPVAYVPGGQDATIAENYLDLRIKNDTGYPIKISAVTGTNFVTIRILGTKEQEKTVQIINNSSNPTPFKTVEEYDANIPVGTKRTSQKGSNGFTVMSYRIVKSDGKEIKNEFLSKSVYLPMDRIETVNPLDKGRDWSIPITPKPPLSTPETSLDNPANELLNPPVNTTPNAQQPTPQTVIDEPADIILD